jgi:hypothetical protein
LFQSLLLLYESRNTLFLSNWKMSSVSYRYYEWFCCCWFF